MEVLLKPIITEKMTQQGDDLNKFGFLVNKNANKVQIKKAVEEMYGVTVEEVNTLVFGGKRKSRYTKTGVISGKASSFKKSIVTLGRGETIDFFSNI